MKETIESEFLYHEGCPCGSSDARAVYDDGHTHCFSCGATTQPEGGPIRRETNNNTMSTFTPVEGVYKDLGRRRLTATTCTKFGYSVAEHLEPVEQVANFRDPDGNLVAQKLRGPNKAFRVLGDMKSAGLFGQHLWPTKGRRVTVTEGEIDCMTVSQLQGNSWPTVSIPNGAQSAVKAVKKAIDFLEGFEEVVFMFDMDEPGQEAARECALLLTPGKGKLANLPLKDPSEMLQANRGDEVVKAIWNAKVYSPDALVVGDAIWDEVTFVDNRPSLPWPYAGLQEKLGGIKPGDLHIIAADTGVGKSEFLRPVAVSLIQQGAKVAYLALEETAQRTALGMMSVVLGRPVWDQEDPQQGVDPTEFRQAYEATAAKTVLYKHFGSMEVDNLIKRIQYAIKACDCTHVFLDHITMVVSSHDDDERKALDRMVTKLASLANETGVSIIAVSHLSRPKDSSRDTGQVSLGRLRGSHAIGQLAYSVVGLERDLQAEGEWKDVTKVRVLKNRRRGDTGIACHLRFNRQTATLQECEAPGDSGFAVEETY